MNNHSTDDSPRERLFRFGSVAVPGTDGVDGFVTLGDRFVAVGAHDALADRYPEADRIDLGDAVVLPGFNDAHMHPTKAAEYAVVANLAPPDVSNETQLASALQREADRVGSGAWVRGVRYDQGKTTGGVFIDRRFLDRAVPDNPVYIRHISGHFGFFNSRALERLGIDRATPDPVGGEIRHDVDGEPTGVLVGRAHHQAAAGVDPLTLNDRMRGLRSLASDLHASGITSVTDAMVMPDGLSLLQSARDQGAFRLRTNVLISWYALDAVEALGTMSGFGDEWLRFGGIKLTWDGAVAGKTCFVHEPFEGSDDRGILLMSPEELRDVVRRVHSGGSRLAIHANGDAAIEGVLDQLEAAHAEFGRPRLRHRIEHGSLVTDEILRRSVALDLIYVPLFSYVRFHGEKLVEFFGEHRLDRLVALRSMLDAGLTVAGSSDYGAGPYPVLANIQAVVTRMDFQGRRLGVGQAVTVDEAIAAYTVAAAESSGEASRKGRIAAGQLADFVVLAEDPRRVASDAIADIPVLSTWIGSELVWSTAE